MKAKILAAIVALLTLAACSQSETPQPARAPAAKPAAPTAKPSFINKVWAVAESKPVETGSMRVFLSDGTLVMTSPHAAPAFGSWSQDGGGLKITEEGLTYDADVLELTEKTFRIRMHSPGEPVEIRFEPATQERATITRAAEPAVAATSPKSLWGTAWRLESLAGAGALNRAQATLEFPSEGRASGSGSCNRFNGVVTIVGNTIRFGGIAATRKACPDAVMKQEDAYFAALRNVERFESDGQTLDLYATGWTEPLHFIATQASARSAEKQVSRAAASATLATTSIWTVVAHYNPGISALSDDAARARYGETVRLTPSAAISSGHRCNEPGYTARTVPAGPYLASEYKLAPGSLKPLAGHDQVHLLEVSCGRGPWATLGVRILEIDQDHALAPWDGVFFGLARDHDFRAVGQEPGWQLEIRKGEEIRFTYDYGKGMAVTPASRAQVDSSTGTQTYHAVAEANDLRVEIVPVRCTDAVSGRPFASTVTVTLNGKTYRGCGEELATPYQG